MRRFALAVILLGQTMINSFAQDASKLTIPNSPAFSILNFEPSAVMRPTNVRSLAADVLNAFDKEGSLLLNLGLEVSPYWLKSHPNLTRETYLNPSVGQAFLQSLSFSAATVKDSVSGNNKFGTGARFKLFNGNPNMAKLNAVRNELQARNVILNMINGVRALVSAGSITTKTAAITQLQTNLQKANVEAEVISTVIGQAQLLEENYADTSADIVSLLEQLISDRRAAETGLIQKKVKLLYERTGFALEFASAASYITTRSTSLEKIGFWGNATYYVSPDDLLTLTARYMFINNDSALNNLDIGLGFLKKAENFNVSLEAMVRHYRAEVPDFNIANQPITRVDKDFTYRLSAQASYLVAKDISINLSLGKEFDAPFISGTGFFSILGLNYSIFSKEPATLK